MGVHPNDLPGPDDSSSHNPSPRFRFIFAADNDPGIEMLCSPETVDFREKTLLADTLIHGYDRTYNKDAGFAPATSPFEKEVAQQLREVTTRYLIDSLPDSSRFPEDLCNALRHSSHLVFFDARVKQNDEKPENPLVSWLVDARNSEGFSVAVSIDFTGRTRWQMHNTGPVFMAVQGRATGDDISINVLYTRDPFTNELYLIDEAETVASFMKPAPTGSVLFYALANEAVRTLGYGGPVAQGETVSINLRRRNAVGSKSGTLYYVTVADKTAWVNLELQSDTCLVSIESGKVP